MNEGSYSFAIRGTDTDWRDRLHYFSLFSFMQETAYANAEANGLGASQLDLQNCCWLLIRISARMERQPRWGETLTVTTWSRGCRKLTWLRDYLFFDETGRRIGGATSEWLIAAADDHRPQRPEAVLAGRTMPSDTHAALDEVITRPPRLDAAPATPVLTRFADFSDIDRNGHVNNTRYVAWCLDAVHALLRGDSAVPADILVSGIDIHYVSELRLGEKIHCFCQPEGERAFLVEARRATDDTPVFRARVLI